MVLTRYYELCWLADSSSTSCELVLARQRGNNSRTPDYKHIHDCNKLAEDA